MARRYVVDPHPKSDPQVQAIITDPEGYFAHAREQAEAEAARYVRDELRRRADVRRAAGRTPRPA